MRSPHGKAKVENRHGVHNQREDAGENRDGRGTWDNFKTVPMKLETRSDEDGIAGHDKHRQRKNKKKRKRLTKSCKSRAEDTSGDDQGSCDSEASDYKKRSSPKEGAEVSQNTSSQRVFFQANPTRTTSRTGRAATDMPLLSVSRKRS